MLPPGPRFAAHQVNRARLSRDRCTLEGFPIAKAKPEYARREQRDPYHIAKYGLVAMPANTCTLTVFGNQHVLQIIRAKSGKLGRCSAYRKQKPGNVIRLIQLFVAKVIAPAKRNNATLSLESVKVEFLEWQVANF